jgi:hypothetical protein
MIVIGSHKIVKIIPIFKVIFSLLTQGGTCMESKDIIVESTNRVMMNFENIKESIQGLYEILKISHSEKNVYFKLGMDNIEALNLLKR